MTIFLSLVFFSAAVLLLYKIRFARDLGDLASSIDLEIKKLIRNQPSYKIVIGVFKDNTDYRQGFSAAGADATPDENSIFQIGSLSKLFTATTFEQLVNADVLSANTTIGDTLGSRYLLHKFVKPITLEQLASHTSGFPKDPQVLIKNVEQRVGKDNLLNNPFSYISTEDVFSYLKQPTDIKPPGKFVYSNFGMGLLGHLMAIRLGVPFEKIVKDYMLLPRGMTDSNIHLSSEQTRRLVPGFSVRGTPADVWTFGALDGAGAFYSNLKDMMYFLKSHLRIPGKTGWMKPTFLDTILGNSNIYWHNGQVGGYGSYIAIDLEKQYGLVILCNQSVNLSFFGAILTRLVRTQSWLKK